MRVFVAVDPPEDVRDALWRAMAAWRGRWPGIRWEHPAKLHLTLRFLGEVAEGDVGALSGALDSAASRSTAFGARLGGFGCYPSLRSPRVVWVGLAKGGDDLVELQQSVENALEDNGFGRESRSFTPHLTVGRVKEPLRGPPLHEVSIPVLDFPVDRLILKQSTLTPGGSLYTEVASFSLGGHTRKE